MRTTQSVNALLIPCVSGTGAQAHSIHSCRNLFIGIAVRHASDDFDSFGAVSSVVLASGFFLDFQLRVPATGPVDQQYDFAVLLINIRDDLLDEDTNYSLFQAHVRSCSPHAREIMGKAHQQ